MSGNAFRLFAGIVFALGPLTWLGSPGLLSHAHMSGTDSGEAAKLNQRGLEHLKKKEYDTAIQLFRDALKIQADYADALDNLGKALDAVGKDPEAIDDFDRALKLAPQNAVFHSNKGLAL